MGILKISDANGNVQEILVIKGDKGDKGDPGEFAGGELLNAHINDENNPHKATAEQIGARPNTWMPTAADVGAAPAGYGLGGYPTQQITSVEALNNAVKIGWYQFACLGAKIANVYINYANVFVLNYVDTASVFQEIRPVGTNIVIRRTRYQEGTSWGEWEIENPPMVFGVEYRTTERHNGNVVYTQKVNIGDLPNATYKTVSCVTFTSLVDVRGTVNYTNFFSSLLEEEWVTDFHVSSNGELYVRTDTDVSKYTATVQIWYTKD